MQNKNIFELDPERLATTDEHGNRVYLYPEDVKGIWKSRRKIFYWFLISLYLILPWIYINGRPALMVNIFEREFTFMGFTLHGVEPIIFFPLVASGIFLIAFLTSLLGRVWCGWACPQTVFIQAIFMKIDALVEGKARVRRELEKAPWGLEKLFKRVVKWALFTIVSLHIAHSFIGYFVGPRELFLITTHSPQENWGLFVATMIVSAGILIDFGWFREQFCLIACPYGRIQSVLMDENSLVVSYDAKRGEPRRGSDSVSRDNEGDCINCYNCVKVCPTGIDIRRGTQLECIHCTQCIDACDDIMTKLNKPKGLIKYSTENEITGKGPRRITKRSVVYASISLILLGVFVTMLLMSTRLNLVFIRSKIPFKEIENGRLLINNFQLKISHQGEKKYQVEFRIANPDHLDRIELITPSHPTIVDVPEKKIIMLFKFPKDLLENGNLKTNVEVIDSQTGEILVTKEVSLVGPVH